MKTSLNPIQYQAWTWYYHLVNVFMCRIEMLSSISFFLYFASVAFVHCADDSYCRVTRNWTNFLYENYGRFFFSSESQNFILLNIQETLSVNTLKFRLEMSLEEYMPKIAWHALWLHSFLVTFWNAFFSRNCIM